MKTISLDATVLTSLMGCARLTDFRFNKLQVRADGKSNSLEVGSLAHFILEHTNRALISGKNRIEAIQIGYAAGEEYIHPYSDESKYLDDKEHKGLLNTPEKSDKHNIGWSYVFDTMRQYFDYWRDDTFIHLGAEETRGKIIFQDEEIQILWKAKFDDIIDTPSGVMSRDYKTMKQRRDTLDLNNQFMGQCICLGARQVLIDKIGFQTSLKPEEKFTRVIIPYSIDRLMEFAQEIVPYYARMLLAYNEAQTWPPNFTHCETKYGFCDYKEICQLDRSMRDEAFKINFKTGKVWDI